MLGTGSSSSASRNLAKLPELSWDLGRQKPATNIEPIVSSSCLPGIIAAENHIRSLLVKPVEESHGLFCTQDPNQKKLKSGKSAEETKNVRLLGAADWCSLTYAMVSPSMAPWTTTGTPSTISGASFVVTFVTTALVRP